MPKTYRIHPAIGIARLGDSEKAFFVGPEAPGLYNFKPPSGSYRDTTDKKGILRQGARFRIYEYTFPSGGDPTTPTSVREITDAEAAITWKVRLVNSKAANPTLNTDTAPDGVTTITDRPTQLRINTGEQPIQGVNQPLIALKGEIFAKTAGTTTVKLGDLTTDDGGRLIVLGGHGKSACPFTPPVPAGSLHNSWWYDDASDGTVSADIRLRADGATPAVESARVLVGPPDFAPAIDNVVSMYDLLFDLATQLPANVRLTRPATVSFTRDIFPVLLRASQMYWVESRAHLRHAPGSRGGFMDPALFALLKDSNPTVGSPPRRLREHVFAKLRNPAGGGTGNMPMLNGGLTLTPTQYEQFRLWSTGTFNADWGAAWQGFPPEIPFTAISDADRPAALDQAALERAVGGAFDPGIEGGEAMAQLANYDRPFRIAAAVAPGTLTQTLSIPWQADFHACDVGWWPGGRPNYVSQDGTTWYSWVATVPSENDMVTLWRNLGFVVRLGDKPPYQYLERERLQPTS